MQTSKTLIRSGQSLSINCYVFEVFITQMVAKEIKFFIMLFTFYTQ